MDTGRPERERDRPCGRAASGALNAPMRTGLVVKGVSDRQPQPVSSARVARIAPPEGVVESESPRNQRRECNLAQRRRISPIHRSSPNLSRAVSSTSSILHRSSFRDIAAHPRERIALGEGIRAVCTQCRSDDCQWDLLADETAQPIIIVSPAAALQSAFSIYGSGQLFGRQHVGFCARQRRLRVHGAADF